MLTSASHANNPSAAKPKTPAESAMGQLVETITGLQERMEALEDRIGPVLNPPTPVNPTKDDACGSPIPLVGEIMNQTARLQRVLEHCNDLIARLGV